MTLLGVLRVVLIHPCARCPKVHIFRSTSLRSLDKNKFQTPMHFSSKHSQVVWILRFQPLLICHIVSGLSMCAQPKRGASLVHGVIRHYTCCITSEVHLILAPLLNMSVEFAKNVFCYNFAEVLQIYAVHENMSNELPLYRIFLLPTLYYRQIREGIQSTFKRTHFQISK